jgi:HK97 family phage major capsid protein
VKKIFETSDIRRVASVQTIGTDALEGIFDLNEASFGWVGETASRPATATPQIGKWRIPVHEMYAMPIVSQKLLDDASFNPEQWLADKLADKFARAENDAFVNNTTNVKPRGFLTYAAGTTLPGTVEQVNSGSASTVTGDGLMNLVFALKTAYRQRAQFGMHRLTVAEIRKLKDSQNRYLWDPGVNGLTQQNVLGYAINEFNDMPVPAANALAIVFADWKEFYQVVDRVGVRVLRDPYTNKPYVQFYATKRTGGDVVNFEAGKIQKFST